MISVVAELGEFSWQDEEWMKEREKFVSREVPVSVYETDITEWKKHGELAAFLKETGYTHVEFHPVMEYLDQNSGGYSTSSYFALTNRFPCSGGRTSPGRNWCDPGLDTCTVSTI